YKVASPAVESFVNSSEILENRENVKSISDKGYHAVPLPYTGNYIPPKPDLMFIDEQVKSDYVDVVSNVASSDVKIVEPKHESVDVKNKGVYNTIETKHVKKNSFSPPIIEDWNSDDERNKCYLTDYDGGFVSFGDGKSRISGKEIKREFSVARTPQQNGIAKKKNRILIEAAITISPVSTVGPSFANTALPSPINVVGTPGSTNAFKEHPFERFSPFKTAFSLPHVPIMTPINDTTILVFRNKKDERGIVVKNKAKLVAQGHTQEDGIDYDEVFTPVARIEAIRLFLAYASFKDFIVYQTDVKSAFLYEKIEDEVYVCQSLGFKDLDFPDKVYKHQHEVNEIRAEKIARIANLLALIAQQQPVYHPHTHPTHYNQNSLTRLQQAATKNRGKAIVNSPQPIYDQEPSMVDDDDETSKDKEIDKLMALISLSFKKVFKPTNNNLRTSSNTSRAN
nr:copia protein [Tanacetum cinerariifolium]